MAGSYIHLNIRESVTLAANSYEQPGYEAKQRVNCENDYYLKNSIWDTHSIIIYSTECILKSHGP